MKPQSQDRINSHFGGECSRCRRIYFAGSVWFSQIQKMVQAGFGVIQRTQKLNVQLSEACAVSQYAVQLHMFRLLAKKVFKKSIPIVPCMCKRAIKRLKNGQIFTKTFKCFSFGMIISLSNYSYLSFPKFKKGHKNFFMKGKLQFSFSLYSKK